MLLNTLFEDQAGFQIIGVRTMPLRKQIQRLDKQLYKGKGFRPKIGHTTLAALHRGQVVAYIVLKPNSTSLYWLRSGVHPDFVGSGVAKQLWDHTKKAMQPLGFEEISARTSDDNKRTLFSQILGEPVGDIKFKHKTVSKFKASLKNEEPEEQATEQRAIQRTATRAGAMYKS